MSWNTKRLKVSYTIYIYFRHIYIYINIKLGIPYKVYVKNKKFLEQELKNNCCKQLTAEISEARYKERRLGKDNAHSA